MENPTKWTLVLCLICLFGNAHGQTADSTSTNPDLKRQSFYQQRAYPHQYVSPDARLKALENLDRIVAGQSARPDGAAPVWTQAEPQATIRGSKASSGVTTSMAADPRNANVVYLGTSNGGVWKTVDGGIHWMPLTDSQPSLSIGSIAVDPAQPEIIYAGTGSELGAWFSVGVLKSTDGGETWTNYPGPFVLDADPRCGEGTRIGALAISPDNPQELLAGVSRCEDSGGIYRSTDGAVTWNRVFSGGAATALFFDPATPELAYASIGSSRINPANGVYKSTDGGQSWTASNGTGPNALPLSEAVTISLSQARSNPATLYASISASDTADRMFKTTDGGRNWFPIARPKGVVHHLAVHPTNSDIVFAGGEALYRSMDGGTTWESVATGANRAVAFSSGGEVLYLGDAGGPHRTADATESTLNWADLGKTLDAGEFYPAAFSQELTQGSVGLPPRLVTQITADPASAITAYATVSGYADDTDTKGHVFRTTDSGVSWTDISGNLPNAPANDILIDPDLPNTFYVATDVGVFHTQNDGATWLPLGTGLPRAEVTALQLHGLSKVLRAATFGRGMWDLHPSVSSSAYAQMLTPTPGSTLSGSSVTFTWTPGTGATGYWLDVGTAPYVGNISGGAVGVTSKQVSGLPSDGSTIYVTLYTAINGKFSDSSGYFCNVYTYTTGRSAAILTPTPNSTLSGSTVTFTWSAISGATEYWLDVGTVPSVGNISGGSVGANTSKQVTGLPVDGSTIYVSLYTKINGSYQDASGKYLCNSYTYTAMKMATATITSPTPNSVLSSPTITFTWTSVAGATEYWLDVGTAPSVGNISGGSVGSNTSKQVTGLPVDGSTIYVSLYTKINGSYQDASGKYLCNSYTYISAKIATITSPAPNSVLPGTAVTFGWAAVPGATEYWLDVGTAPSVGNISGGSVGANTSKQVTGLPTDGSTIYASLYTKLNGSFQDGNGQYLRTSYTYTAMKIGIATITSPAPNSILTSPTVTFTWTSVAGATEYWLDVGTSPSVGNISGGPVGSNTSKQVTGLPFDGSTVYVSLYTKVNGSYQDSKGAYLCNSYTYTAMKVAAITSPAPNSTLGGSTVTFMWTAVSGATEYWLDVGTAFTVGNITSGSVGANTSKTVAGLPMDGSVVYASLYTKINGSFQDSNGKYLRTSFTYRAIKLTAAFVPNTVTINGLTTQNLTLNLSAPAPAGGLVMALSSSNTAVATVPSTATFNAGAITVNVPVTGVAIGGPIAIHASALPTIPDTTAAVTVVTYSAGTISLSSASIGKDLQTTVTLSLSPAVPSGGLPITLTSSDPTKVLIGTASTNLGLASATTTLPEGTQSSTIVLQGLADSGTATVTATAAGWSTGTAAITLTRSGFVIAGPNGIGVLSFATNVGITTPLTVYSARLDSSLNYVETQSLRGGISASNPAGLVVTVPLSSSKTSIGTISPASVQFTGGDTISVDVTFAAVGVGSTTVALGTPSGFSTPTNVNSIAASVGPPGLMPVSVTVGRNLEASASVTLNGAPSSDAFMTISSNDPSKALLSTTPDGSGSASISVKVKAGFTHTPDFYVYGLASAGTTSYTASLTGFGTASGTITLVPSGVVIAGPYGLGAAISTTTGAAPTTLTIGTGRLDANGNYVDAQAVAGLGAVSVSVSSGNNAVGAVSSSPVTIAAGSASATTQFQPSANGSTNISVNVPSGFSAPSQYGSVAVTVSTAGIAVTDGVPIGKNLAYTGYLSLGQTPPAGGVTVTLSSNNPSQLLLALHPTDAGSTSITVTITPPALGATYYLYALDNTGTVGYTASAPGYASRTASAISLTPSGIVLEGSFGIGSQLYAPLSAGNTAFYAHPAQLDGSGNVVQIAPVAGGRPVTASLSSSNSGVGTVPTQVTIAGGSDTTTVQFHAIAGGTTKITAAAPAGLTTPAAGAVITASVY